MYTSLYTISEFCTPHSARSPRPGVDPQIGRIDPQFCDGHVGFLGDVSALQELGDVEHDGEEDDGEEVHDDAGPETAAVALLEVLGNPGSKCFLENMQKPVTN